MAIDADAYAVTPAIARGLNPMIDYNLFETTRNVAAVLDFLSLADAEDLSDSARDGLSLVLCTASKALRVSADLNDSEAG